jgi:hypothetical protein
MSCYTTENGTRRWYNEYARLHRDNDLPAVEYTNGTKHWYANGKLHRDNDLPAVIYGDGAKSWYINGKRYRINDLPVAESANGTKYWYANGNYHRDNDLPAIECADGTKHWYANGKVHRLGGLPAKEFVNGNKEWWIYDRQFTYEQVCNYYKILKIFGRHCLRKIRMKKIRRVRWIHGELLCMPVKGSYPGGQDYYQMVSYFMSM